LGERAEKAKTLAFEGITWEQWAQVFTDIKIHDAASI
jgi:hypothetical protein